MSLVKIQGNPSGTGAFTIASPSGNTDRTLTLPDATGTIFSSADIASQAEAEAGTSNTTLMTPQRANQAISAQVGTAIAGLAYGAVGTYIYGSLLATNIADNSTYAGSSIVPAGILTPNTSQLTDASGVSAEMNGGGSALSGTWRAMGRSQRVNTTTRARISLFLRIS